MKLPSYLNRAKLVRLIQAGSATANFLRNIREQANMPVDESDRRIMALCEQEWGIRLEDFLKPSPRRKATP